MTTEVRTFKAASMQEALEVVRREMGTQAVILHTRQSSHRRLLPWQQPRVEVEITAGVGVNIRPAPARPAAQSAASQPISKPDNTAIAGALASALGARALAPQNSPRPAAIPLPDDSGVELKLSSYVSGRKPAGPAAAPPAPSIPVEPTPPAPESPVPTNVVSGTPAEAPEVLVSKLDSIQRMVEQLGRARHVGGGPEVPSELFHLYTDLIDAEVEDEVARDLIFRLKQECKADQLRDAHGAGALLKSMVEADIRCSDPIRVQRGRRRVVALVGPTGVGKTTTIAKLAANFRLRDGIRMGLVTVDTYRIAAVEQLRTYAEIIDLPMKVVTSPREMRRALDELSGMDLVLIDTAGRSPRDELKIQELKSLLGEAQVDEVHLVLSLTASLRSIEATASKFSAANTTSLILTKLDEAAGMGTLLSVARKVPLPLSYFTTGQDVPDDIEPSTPGRAARLILGEDRLFD